jgi:hypothetical protein
MAIADAEGFNAPKATRTHRYGEEGEVRRSPQAVACRKRGVEELGRPQTLLGVERRRRGYIAPEARKGKPGHGTMLEPKLYEGTRTRQAEKYCHRERPLDAPGESYHAEYSAVGKAHYKGKDVTAVRSPHRQLLPDTVGPEDQEPTSLRGIANKAKADTRHRFRDLYRCLGNTGTCRGGNSSSV